MRPGTERNKDTTLCSTKQETWLNGGKCARRAERERERDWRDRKRDSEKGQHRRRRGRLEGDFSTAWVQPYSFPSWGNRRRGREEEERKSERNRERVPDLIYRRGVSVIISPSLSSSRRRVQAASPPQNPRCLTVYLHPSGYRDCGPISPRRRSVPLAPGHPWMTACRFFQLPAGASHSLVSPLLFPRTFLASLARD